MNVGRLWHLDEALSDKSWQPLVFEYSQQQFHLFYLEGGLSSVLEKLSHRNFPSIKIAPRKIAARKITFPPCQKKKKKKKRKKERKKRKKNVVWVFLLSNFILFNFFVQILKLLSLSIFLFLIRIKFFHDCLFLYSVILGFQLHIATWPTMSDYWTKWQRCFPTLWDTLSMKISLLSIFGGL